MEMKITRGPLQSAQATAAEMARLSVQYAADLGEKSSWPLQRIFAYVKNLPYRRDPQNVESLARPAYTMRRNFPWRDCDDKAIILGAWCSANLIPFRFLASSRRPDKTLHHVFLEAQAGAAPIILDATYPSHKLGSLARNDYTDVQPLTDWIMPQIQVLEGPFGFLPKNLGRKIGNVAKKGVHVAATPVRVAKRGVDATLSLMARNIPGPLRRQIESAVRKIVGNRTVTPAIKAAVIAPATAAALAIPGMQIYSPAVPIVLNEILNKMIKEAKKMLPNQSAGGSSAPAASLKNLKANLVKAKKATAQSPATADLVARLKAARTAAQAVTPEQRAANTARNDAAFAQRQTAAPAAGLAKFALPAAGLAALFFIMRKK
jgi:hypothetical protein